MPRSSKVYKKRKPICLGNRKVVVVREENNDESAGSDRDSVDLSASPRPTLPQSDVPQQNSSSEQGARTFCGVMNMLPPASFKYYNNVLCNATKEVSLKSMKTSAEESVQVELSENDDASDESRDIMLHWMALGRDEAIPHKMEL
ncbi:hypothetical protein J6590_070538 [Homalodisca vitripennis]|nr:hypothetical protein J6590_070538 [Homalodisca vitripennis]